MRDRVLCTESINFAFDSEVDEHDDDDDFTVPGCKFPLEIQGRWNFTYQHAKMLEIWQKNATLHLMSGQDIKFFCDKRDGGVFVFRSEFFYPTF